MHPCGWCFLLYWCRRVIGESRMVLMTNAEFMHKGSEFVLFYWWLGFLFFSLFFFEKKLHILSIHDALYTVFFDNAVLLFSLIYWYTFLLYFYYSVIYFHFIYIHFFLLFNFTCPMCHIQFTSTYLGCAIDSLKHWLYAVL